MFRYLFLFIFFIISSLSFAGINEAGLQKKYGEDLIQAPFFLRFHFSKLYSKDWKESTYPERRNYLNDYEDGLIKESKKEKAEAKAEAVKEKQLLQEKKAEDRELNARLKASEKEEKAELQAEAEREEAFKKALDSQSRELEEMRRNAETRRMVHGPENGPAQGPEQSSSQGSY
jgi:hypothetical protein